MGTTGRYVATLAATLFVGIPAFADTVMVDAMLDNTMYSQSDSLSNGMGDHFLAGRTGGGDLRRGLVAFDVAGSIPAGSTIETVTLELFMSRTIVGTHDVSLRRVLAEWGEGTSHAAGEEGGGAVATAGDATWEFRMFDTDSWDTDGGDFSGSTSATAPVGGLGAYNWSSPAMVADVMAWLDDPASNFGWIVIGNEGGPVSAKRFDSRTNPTASRRPVLVVEFTPPVDCPADLDDSGDVGFTDLLSVLAAWGPCAGCPEDFDDTGDVGFTDLLVVLSSWGPCP